MTITPHDPGTYLVTSETVDGDSYMVDMGDPERPDGACSCTDYTMRIEPLIARGQVPVRTRCKHLRAVAKWIELACQRKKIVDTVTSFCHVQRVR